MAYEIEIIADYHTHTRMAGRLLGNIPGKHAKGSIKENAIVAIRRGLKEIAITDQMWQGDVLFATSGSFAELRMTKKDAPVRQTKRPPATSLLHSILK